MFWSGWAGLAGRYLLCSVCPGLGWLWEASYNNQNAGVVSLAKLGEIALAGMD